MSKIILKDINKYYGKNHVLKNLDLTIEEGEFMTLLGPSGCGKTTTLRIIAGLEKAQSGTMYFDDKTIIDVDERKFEPPAKRELNLVFQSYALWPHMTVFNNVSFGLETKKVAKKEIEERVNNALNRLQILEFANRYPSELSGGQQQRVAIARSIVSEPKTLLLDEPLSNLDAKLRIEMRSELKRLHKALHTTVVYVTHDQIEALTMSTRIAVFFNGSLIQVDTPVNIYTNPKTLQVAGFIGNPSVNFVDGSAKMENNKLTVKSALGTMQFDENTFTEEPIPSGDFPCVLAVRPENILVSGKKSDDAHMGVVYSSMPAGSETLVHFYVGEVSLLTKEIGLAEYELDEELWLTINPKTTNIFDKHTGNLIKKASVESKKK